MSRTSLGSVLLGGKQKTIRAVSLSVVFAMLLSVTMPVAIVAAEADGTASNHNQNVSATEVAGALKDTGVLGGSDQVAVKTDGDSAVTTDTNRITVDIPKDATQGVTFGADSGPKLDVSLPNAEDAGAAKQVAPGVVAYDSGNGSATAVQATEDGGVRMLTIIDNPNAPTQYDYKVSVPTGGSIQLTEFDGAEVIDGQGEVISTVDAPWAKDAVGTPVETWFTTDGKTLTQHVEHDAPGIVYPVTADPFWDAVKNAASKAVNLAKQALKAVWRGALGCIAGREFTQKGVKYFLSKGGKKYVLSKLGTRWVPYLGWVSCGYGAWDGVRN